ncbi:hypothetical protein [Micromonospora matsumotoense]|uniref:hypothetical protein n=1 Tax=Micromonospora matsumotoense TaxID=121616 RepID=UPI00114CCDB5|nr:hypothetical protein [Micromonospora matsumotoense]
MTAVHGQHHECANDVKVATVDLQAFSSPDGHDKPPSVTLAIDNPEQRPTDMTKLDGMDHNTVRNLAASLLSGFWDRTTIRLTPQKTANLGTSLIAASRTACDKRQSKPDHGEDVKRPAASDWLNAAVRHQRLPGSA